VGNGGGVAAFGDAATRTEVSNSIIAGNTNNDVVVANPNNPDDTINTFQSNGFNLIGTGNAVTEFVEAGDVTGNTDPGLAALADNGGRTQTRAPLTGSPAVNAGDTDLATDQRGVPRPQGGADDKGAFEARTLSIGNVSQKEGNSGSTPLVFTVALSSTNTQPITVFYTLGAGTTTAGERGTITDSDGGTPGVLTIPADTLTGTITVPVVGDTVIEDNETFTLTLSSSTNAVITGATGTGTIQNDDFESPSLVVTTTTDTISNTDNVTSLREAIAFANEKWGEDTIFFDSTVFAAPTKVITLGNGSPLPSITGVVTITGPSAGVIVTGRVGAANALFSVSTNATATLTKLGFVGSKDRRSQQRHFQFHRWKSRREHNQPGEHPGRYGHADQLRDRA
jgi:hypothetical protein